MKNTLKYISLSLFLAAGLTSCESDDTVLDDKVTDIGGYSRLTDQGITRLDRNSDLNIEFFTAEGVSPESVEIIQDGEVIGDATISGETASFNSSILGDFTFPDDDEVDQETGSYPISIRTTYSNGKVSQDSYSISVDRAVSLGNEDEDNPTETTMDSLSSVILNYEVSTFSADVDDVSLMFKKNDGSTYTDSGVDLSTEGGSVVLSETNYEELNLEVNDTLYYQFTVTSGDLTDKAESMVAIIPKDFQNSNSVTLSNDSSMNQLNLGTAEVSADGTEGAEIRFLEPSGFEVIDGADIDFVEVDSDFYQDADVINAREVYENGNPVTSATDLQNGDVFVYSATREVEDEDGETETMTYYGVFRIGNVTVVDGSAVSYDIDYSEGR